MKKFLLFVLMLLPLVASADDSGKCGENVYYHYNSTNHTLTIYGEGAMESVDIGNIGTPWGAYRNEIHSLIIEDGVTEISGSAFSGCSGLTSLTIPNSVTSIGGSAFSGCSGLTSIQVESGNQKYDSRNNCNAIIDNNNQLIAGCRNTIIPNSVTSIGTSAFYGCSGLTSITLPQNIVYIGSYAFWDCKDLVYITLPLNLNCIDLEAFDGCYNITDIYCKAKNVMLLGADDMPFFPSQDATLHVPSGSLEHYKNNVLWGGFKSYLELSDNDLYASEKCSKPSISIVDGKFIFNCETSGIRYKWRIATPSGNNGSYSIVPSSITLYVYATKSGYLPSDVATYEFSGLAGDVNNDGEVNVADHVKLSDIIMGQE